MPAIITIKGTIGKTACFTDIHFGKKSNSQEHNQDCLDFVLWFIERVKEDPEITHIAFLGDWFENRAAINILTLEYARAALKLLSSLGLPIIIIVGNHDLHRRSTREVFSTKIFEEFDNVVVINEPTIVDGALFCPYMFEKEYPSLAEFNNVPYWYGHFEFRNFMVTGYNLVLHEGPDHTQFTKPRKIFAGHFHKRQARDNVVYIGNTFPMDFGDAGDDQRGMMICDHQTDNVVFENWEECPRYYKTTLSKILDNDWDPKPKMRVKVLLDIEISYSEVQQVREALISAYDLRELTLEDNANEKKEAIAGEDEDEDADLSMSVDELVVKSLSSISDVKTISPEKLIKIYKKLNVQG